MALSPDELGAWIRILRDTTIVAVGTFMLVFETVVVHSPNPYVIGAGLVALGLPPALRIDMRTPLERRQDRGAADAKDETDYLNPS